MSSVDYQAIIDRYYPHGSRCREILQRHSEQVAAKAEGIARELHLPVDIEQVRTAAMLHDIGIYLTDAPGIDCHGKEAYLRHGILGAALLRAEGAPEWAARVAERHTGAGISVDDIRALHLPLPERDLMPETLLERLVCYADKFFSKSHPERGKTTEQVRQMLSRFPDADLERWDRWVAQFG